MPFVARRAELRELERLLGSAAAGHGEALVLDGEAGIGKSTLIDTAVGALEGFEVLRASGAEFEQDLLYAVLHQLCAPLLDYRLNLPAVQRRALEAIFGLAGSLSPDQLTVNLAVLGLLAEAASERPVCCVVDDAQWSDEASRKVLVFVARRVTAARIALVFAARDVRSLAGLEGLPRLSLSGLEDEDARALLGATVHVGVNTEVTDRILAEARGNPLALHEFAHEAEPFGVTRHHRVHASVLEALEQQFIHRFEQLPDATRMLVVLAAAEPVGDLSLLRRAARLLGSDPADLVHAENAALLTLGPRLRFRHPLVRSVVYASATSGVRRRVHGALAQATDSEADPDRRAWHRAHSVTDADEQVATELEDSADRAYNRGGFGAAAAFMERASQLTPAREAKVRRLLAAGLLRLRAGAPTAARELVAEAERHCLNFRDRAAADLLRARIDFQISHTLRATTTLVDVVGRTAPDQAPETYLEALASFMYNEHQPGRLRELATRIRDQSPRGPSARPCELLLDGLLDQTMLPVKQAVPAMRAAVESCRAAPRATGPWRNLLCQLVIDLRDDEAMVEIPDRQVEVARRQGALASLPQALRYQAIARVSVGLFDEAAAMLGEARHIDEAAGTPPLVGPELVHAAFRGDVDRFRELQSLLGSGGRPFEIAGEYYANAVLNNGLGNYGEALGSALAAQCRHQAGSYTIWAIYSELVEAAARAGRGEDAATALHHLEALAMANPLPWAVAEWRQAQALLGHDVDRDMMHRAAIDSFAETRVRVLHARARLTYGEWLRREN